jgi:DNA-binding XRE family transcriptional regulator
MTKIQFIEQDGRRTFAVVPYALFERMARDAEMAGDICAYREAKAADDGFRVPLPVMDRMLEGASALLAWREHLGMTQAALARKAGISVPYLSQLETGKRAGSLRVFRALGKALDVPPDAVAPDDVSVD